MISDDGPRYKLRALEHGTIAITRRREGFVDRLRSYRILIDQKEAGRLRRGESFEIAVHPGRHAVRMKIDWTGSPTVDVDVGENERVALECGPNVRLWRAWIETGRSIGNRERWVYLRHEPTQ